MISDDFRCFPMFSAVFRCFPTVFWLFSDDVFRLLKFSSSWTKLSMMGPQLFSGWYQMILDVCQCSQLFFDVFSWVVTFMDNHPLCGHFFLRMPSIDHRYSNTPLGGIDKAMMDDVKRDWEEWGGRGLDTRSRPGYSSLLTLIYNQIRLNCTMMKKA